MRREYLIISSGWSKKERSKQQRNLYPKTSLSKKNTAAKYLSAGDEIAYNDTTYKVQGHLKQGRLRMEDMGTGKNFVLSKNDVLYGSLLDAKQNPEKHNRIAVEAELPVVQETTTVAAYGIRR